MCIDLVTLYYKVWKIWGKCCETVRAKCQTVSVLEKPIGKDI